MQREQTQEREIRLINELTTTTLKNIQKNLNSLALVRKRTLPTERPPRVGEVNDNFCGWSVSRGKRNEFPRPLVSVF
jgi:hypothetical protein